MDIDIDFADRSKALALFNHTVASRNDNGQLKQHNTGIYVTEIPKDVINNLSTIDYKTAEARGYFKIDFLNVSIYSQIKSEQHLIDLMNTEPLWDLLEQREFIDLLFHVNGHSDLLQQMKPKSIDELAMCLALIRPAKKHLIGLSWEEIKKEIWLKPTNNEYYFKKAHAYSYSVAVTVHMNLICESID